MRVSEKQILTMTSWLTTMMSNCEPEKFSVVTITPDGYQQIRQLLNNILSQQSDEIKDITDNETKEQST